MWPHNPSIVRRYAWVPLLCALLALGCASSAAQPAPEPTAPAEPTSDPTAQTVPPTVSLGQAFELAIGGAVVIAETGTQIMFSAVQEDSRCPARVNCIWAGRVSIAVEAQAPAADVESFTLATCCDSDAHEHAYASQRINLLGVTPAPGPPGQPIDEQDYRAKLVVSIT